MPELPDNSVALVVTSPPYFVGKDYEQDLQMAFESRPTVAATNPLGVKGCGEAGVTGALPAVMNAVVDALWDAAGIAHLDMPATPERVWAALGDAARRTR